MMLPPVVTAALAQIQREARAAGYAAGYADGYADGEAAGREAERAALAAALLDAAAEVRRREGGAPDLPEHGAPGPLPAAEAGTPVPSPSPAAPADGDGAAVVPPLEDRRREDADRVSGSGAPSPSFAAEAGPPSPPVPDAKLPSPAAPMVQAGADAGKRRTQAQWKTVARRARFEGLWPDAAWTVRAIWRDLAGMDGPPMPASHLVLYQWANDLGLGRRGGNAPSAEGQPAAPELAAPAAAEPEPEPAEMEPSPEAADAETPAPVEAPEPPAGDPAPPPPVTAPPASAPTEGWQTEARRVLLEQHYPDGIPLSEIRALMGALPGATVPPGGVSAWAKALGLECPATAGALPPPNPKVERIPRTCLRCERKFTAEGRFERLCAVCRKASEGIAA